LGVLDCTTNRLRDICLTFLTWGKYTKGDWLSQPPSQIFLNFLI